MLGVKPFDGLRRLQIEAQQLLNADRAQLRRPFGQVEEKNQVEPNRSRQNRIAAKVVERVNREGSSP